MIWNSLANFGAEGAGSSVSFCCLTLMVQAAVLEVLVFDAPPFSQDGFAAPEVDVSRCQVADALVVAMLGPPIRFAKTCVDFQGSGRRS